MGLKNKEKQLLEIIWTLRTDLEGLTSSPIVSGMRSAIRDRAKRDYKIDPYTRALASLEDTARKLDKLEVVL